MKLQVMNQEEFDNKLSDSFKQEHLPPDKRLWENISARLDESPKKRFPLWLIPVFIAVVAAGAWLIGSMGHESKLANTTDNKVVAASENKASIDTEVNTAMSQNTAVSNDNATTSQNGGTKLAVATGYIETEIDQPKSSRVNNPNKLSIGSLINSNAKTIIASDPLLNKLNTTERSYVLPANYDFNDIFLGKALFSKPSLATFSEPEEESSIDAGLKTKKGRFIRSRYTKQPVNFDSKWWWSVGAGPQISGNKAIINNDSVSWIHKDLWNNRDMMSHSGTGFHSQFLLGHRFGQHFSIESGLQFNIHTEDINFNITSYSVETRDQKSNIITAYEDSLVLWIHLVGAPDSTFYYATRNFSLASKNRYHIFSIPIKFNYEQNITSNTKLIAGLGMGFSGITSKSVTHLNLTNDRYIVEKKSTQFTASFSAQLGLYTNINEIGQLGFYTNFQMYAKPWEMGNKQYAIRMSDLQFGLSFRRPLNWR
jgi:hypothetical protein